MARDLVVWGLHRSGTSMLARCLEAMGWRFGNVNRTATAENPGGVYEHYRLVELNGLLLADLGTRWDDWAFDFPAASFATGARQALAASARAMLGDLAHAGAAPWALKDPRMAALAGFWLPLLAEMRPAPGHLLLVRDPEEVARSQLTRAMEKPADYALLHDRDAVLAGWVLQMLQLLRALPADDTLLLSHRRLIGEPEAALGAVARFAGAGPVAEAAAVVDPRYYRSRGDGASASAWGVAAGRLHAALVETERSRAGIGGAAAILAEFRDIEAMRPYLGPVSRLLAAARRDGLARFRA